MGQTGRNVNSNAVQPNRSASRSRSVRYAKSKKRRKTLTIISCILAIAFVAIFALKPASASTKTLLQSFHVAEEAEPAPVEQAAADSIVQIQSADDSLVDESSDFALRDINALSIVSWQGAKNCGDSFPVTLQGVDEEKVVSFSTTNCTVFPQTGPANGTYTVTVTGAGAYSMTAIADGESAASMCDTRTGVAGKADQASLSVGGWGGAQDYYHTFNIIVFGGSTDGAITFETDGCTVSPTTGRSGGTFLVTVTRVGSYGLTAMMDGDRNFNNAYSAYMSGCASKSNQAPIHIEDWQATPAERYLPRQDLRRQHQRGVVGRIARCTVEKVSSMNTRSASRRWGRMRSPLPRRQLRILHRKRFGQRRCRKGRRAFAFGSGWASSKNCNDSFPIRVSGGVSDANDPFCGERLYRLRRPAERRTRSTRSPSHRPEAIRLTAMMDGTDSYESASTRTYKASPARACKARCAFENWIESELAGSSFEITVSAEAGPARLPYHDDGMHRAAENRETNVYVVSVNPLANTPYFHHHR
jgi:hypothetical protein